MLGQGRVSLSLLEAQSCGVPVIATDVGGCREAVSPSYSNLIPAGDEQALVSVLKGKHAAGASTALREFIIKNGSLVSMLDRYKPYYNAA